MPNLKDKLSFAAHTVLNLLYPPVCPACGCVTGSLIDGEMCDSCRQEFEKSFISICPRCENTPKNCTCAPDLCGSSSNISPYTTVHPLIYQGYYTGYDSESIVSRLVYTFKRDNTCGGGIMFARMLARGIMQHLILHEISPKNIILTYIPRSDISLGEYGFDHMEIVTRETAKLTGCIFEKLFIRRGGATQKELSPEMRLVNADSTIEINKKKTEIIKGGEILLLDDIVTTGSSMKAAVSKLSFAGAKTVIPACIMVSVKPKKEDPR